MRRKSRWSSTVVGERISALAVAPVTTVRVKIIGDVSESAVAAAKRRFAKTQSFEGVLPRCDAGSASSRNAAEAVTCLSSQHASPPDQEVPTAARPDSALAQDGHEPPEQASAQDDADHRTTLRVSAVKRSRALQLWQRQTPWVAFCLAASLCVLCLLAVNLLAP